MLALRAEGSAGNVQKSPTTGLGWWKDGGSSKLSPLLILVDLLVPKVLPLLVDLLVFFGGIDDE